MSGVRALVGTRKGSFVITSDAKRERWDIHGPHFAGWEVYHLKGSPADCTIARTCLRGCPPTDQGVQIREADLE